MNKITLTALIALSLPMGGNALAADFSDTAQVVSALPIYERFNEPKRDCWLETTTPQAGAAQDDRSPTGALIGGIAGGILGHQVGKGSGKDVATALGAITGAIVGDRMQNNAGTTRTVERCRVVDNWSQRLTGYSVTYRYAGREFSAVLPNDPGSRLRINVQVNPF